CKVILIATGAKVVLPVLQELAPHFSNECLLISVATGHTIQEAQMALGNKEAKVVHAIPNTPDSVTPGGIGVALPPTIEGQTKELVIELLAT
ncbi:pyrroline-5-carboxylate reductase, partial [Enterococcus faecalis]|uniref:pyrroline-5-carboxylate reductase family protein n=1 Tax=Enterococcus faecalis TaxID=1351 RepID=UPI0031CD6CB5